ncbi:MAG: ABC transporter permease, partial [Rubrivivax sp.]
AWRSAWNRRFVLSLTVLSVALSCFLLVSLERLRTDVRQQFSRSVSGTDLIVGARTGDLQLLLYAVFRLGHAAQNMSAASVKALEAHRAVAWVVPISLGDSHRGFPVVATTTAYFDHFQYGDRQALQLARGRRFDGRAQGRFEAVLGAEVARRLGHGVGSRLVLSHGDGALEDSDHADQPFVVVGVLKATGTPVDRSVHIDLQGMEALHADWMGGVRIPGWQTPRDDVGSPLDGHPQGHEHDHGHAHDHEPASPKHTLTPRSVTAALVGLKSRVAVFSVQRWVSDVREEPLMAVLPGVALDQLWHMVGVGEKALMAVIALVSVVSIAGLVAVIMASLNERRRELAILRAVGAGPRQLWLLLSAEGALVTVLGAALGLAASLLAAALLQEPLQQALGLSLSAGAPDAAQWRLVAAVIGAGWLASLLPGWRAFRMSLHDGLTPRV